MAPHTGLVLAHGTFDPFHPGHLAYLSCAKQLGTRLIVSVTSDRYVREQKGPGRPVIGEFDRMAMIHALTIVDGVVLSDAPTAIEIIRRFKPAVYAKGWDYAHGDPSGRLDGERAVVEEHGGRLEIIEAWPRYSSTALI